MDKNGSIDLTENNHNRKISSENGKIQEKQPFLPADLGVDIICKSQLSPIEEVNCSQKQVEQNFNIQVTKKFKISINKNLIALRLVLFMWFGGSKITTNFIAVLLKQKGITLAGFSSILSVTWIIQFLTVFLSGLAADKTGNSKNVLMSHILLHSLAILGLIVVPSSDQTLCNQHNMHTTCHDFTSNYSNDLNKLQDNELLNCSFECAGNNKVENFANIRSTFNISDSLINSSHLMSNGHGNKFSATSLQVSNFSNISNMHLLCEQFKGNNCEVICIDDRCTESSSYTLRTIYFILTLCFFASNTAIYRFFDVVVMSVLRKNTSHFGHERVYSMLGAVFILLLSGLVFNGSTSIGSKNNYESIFWFCIGIEILILLVLIKVPTNVQPPGQSMFLKGLKLIKNLEFLIFFIVLFILGSSFMFDESFTFIYLESLKAPGILMTLNATLRCLYGIPVLMSSSWWLKKLRTSTIIVISLLFHSINHIGNSFLQNPWLSLLLEATKVVSYHMLWVSIIVYSNKKAPEGLEATVIATAGAIHFNLGRAGAAVGGLLIQSFGFRNAYRIVAGICILTAVLFVIFRVMVRKTAGIAETPDKKQETEDNEDDENEDKSVHF